VLGGGYRVFRSNNRPAATVAYADGLAD
jgi:hypothetical protein